MRYYFNLDLLSLLTAYNGLGMTRAKIMASRDDLIKAQKRPDMVTNLGGCIEELNYSEIVFRELEKEYRVATSRNFDLEGLLLQKEAELIELRKQNENLKNGL